MSSLFDFDKPALYAVMGNPVAHSKSPRIHGLFAAATGQRLHYSAIQVDPGGFEQAVSNFIAHGGKGLNVTVPFKGNAWALAKRRSLRAELARAVNTIVVEKDGTLFGDNTDGVGLIADLMRNHGADLGGKDVLLLGAGGAASGVIGPLLAQQPARLLVANRNADRAIDLIERFPAGARAAEGILCIPVTSAARACTPPTPRWISKWRSSGCWKTAVSATTRVIAITAGSSPSSRRRHWRARSVSPSNITTAIGRRGARRTTMPAMKMN